MEEKLHLGIYSLALGIPISHHGRIPRVVSSFVLLRGNFEVFLFVVVSSPELTLSPDVDVCWWAHLVSGVVP